MTELPDPLEVELIVHAIQRRYGSDFSGYEPKSLARRLMTAATQVGAATLGEYLRRIIYEPQSLQPPVDSVTVRVTEMFRDPHLFEVLRTRVLPLLETYPYLKVWHAGCASGEEPYTMAILLEEAGLAERAHIYATDVSPAAIATAATGIYSLEAVPQFESNYLESGGLGTLSTYLTFGYSSATITERLRRRVSFFQHDLVSDYGLGEMHMIVCRNVLLYFGQTLRDRVGVLFKECLHPGGFLCLGANESLPPSIEGFFSAVSEADNVYRFTGAG
jgi:chemotaxis protein methyltransferase CheR